MIGRPLEKAVQQQVTALFRVVGGVVRSTSQYRASGVALGLPDLHVSFVRIGRWCWFECKRPLAKGFDVARPDTWLPEPLRPEQERFRLDCLNTAQPYYVGGVREAERLLITFGLACEINGVFTLTPQGRAA